MSLRFFSAIAFLLSMAIVWGCSNAPPCVSPPAMNSSSTGAAAIETYDANKDGKIEGAELDKSPALRSALKQIDADGDDAITADEITARIEAWQKPKIDRMMVSVVVFHNGHPLAGAHVKFIPEKFLGENRIEATGTTAENGLTMVSVPVKDPTTDRPGVPPGFYFIEITKEGENIPAKYNTATMLGCEVATDSEATRSGIRIHLNY